jgi:hypothetical protein
MQEPVATLHPGLIPNDLILAAAILGLVAFLVYEAFYHKHHRRRKDLQQTSKLTNASLPRRHIPIPQPVFQGMPKAGPMILDAAALCRYVPPKITIFETSIDLENEFTSSEESKETQPSESVVIGLPKVPGCELGSHSVARMAEDFPAATKADLVRFLVARKGNLEAATEMYRKAAAW